MKKYFLPALLFLWASAPPTFQELGTGIGFGFRILKGVSAIAFVINRITKPDIFFSLLILNTVGGKPINMI